MKKISVFFVLIALASVFIISGCSETQPEQEVIKIATSAPMRGVKIGQDMVDGIKYAFEEVDYKVGGYTIELVVGDDGDETGAWTDELEEAVAESAVADPDVMVYMATLNSGAAKASIPITNQAGLLQLSPINTWPGLTQPGFLPGEPGIFYPTGIRTFFRVCPTDAMQGSAAAIWAKELGLNNIYIFDDGEAYGKGIADIFEQKADELGLNVVGHKTVDKKADDLKSELELIKDQELDLIYFGGMWNLGGLPLVKGIHELGMDMKFMGPDGLMGSEFIAQGGDAAEGVYVTSVGVPSTELTGKGKEFFDNYKVSRGEEPGMFVTFGYEAGSTVIEILKRAGVKDRAKILEEASKIRDFEGIFGTWSFDQNGDTSLSLISGNKVADGKFAFEKLLS